MLIQEILNRLREGGIIVGNVYNFRIWKTPENVELKKIIQETRIDSFFSFQEKIWFFCNFGADRPKCEVCEKATAFLSVPAGFRSVCSRSCSGLSDTRKQKIKNTTVEKYGVAHHTQSQQFKDASRARDIELGYHPGGFGTEANSRAIFKKYGVTNVSQSEEVKNTMLRTFQEKYGVNNPQQVLEIRNKTKQTNVEKYGQDGWNPEQTKKTLLRKYGVDNPLKSAEILEKIRITSQSRYGTDSPMQNPEIFERCQLAQSQTRYKFKKLVLPSGDIRWVQGYEPQVINYLLLSEVEEDDLMTCRSTVPSIKYTFENKQRVYFPDIFIKSKNMLIEVKSIYTWNREIAKNLAKHDAAKAEGYKHLIIIWDVQKNGIREMIN